ncbi:MULTISPECIES: hypothetical protein [unclassified Streptomyces]|uniref:hypothetical protein n=1 Tax=unclassified Streptomyces TaxID=2593676 RepID=UPI00131A9E63|nr:hypothetical protein [Streptomyces sp. CB01635]
MHFLEVAIGELVPAFVFFVLFEGLSSRRRRQRDALQPVHRQQLDRRQPDPYQGLQDLAAPALAFHEGEVHLAGTDRRLWHTAYYNGVRGPATALTFKFGGAKRRHALQVRESMALRDEGT